MEENKFKEILKDYAGLKVQEKAIAEELKRLNPIIKESLLSQGLDKLEVSEVGNFTLKKIKVWEFSAAVKDAEAKVDTLKEEEKAIGVATHIIRNDLMFGAAKN